jgi:hypothetical protein
MVNCTSLSFKRFFSHVQAHQDDKDDFSNLERPSQLNCIFDGEAKLSIIQTDLLNLPHQRAFPLEPITLFVDNQKVTTESGPVIRFAAQRQEARAVFAERGVLFFGEQFDEVAWRHVYSTLHHVPKMFQIFICKQVFDISATFHFYNKRDATICPMCPSCTIARETAGHILRCNEEGRVKALHKFSMHVMQWMGSVGTNRDLIFLVGKYIRGRGHLTMEEICDDFHLPPTFCSFALSQDRIGPSGGARGDFG